jgi:MoaA/NifB/PqqE/SkfB family radical SAM enzyme
MLRSLQRRLPNTAWFDVKEFFRLPPYPHTKITPKRVANLYLSRIQKMRAHEKLSARPLVLTIEAANVCNLACPYCFTGAGEASRTRGHFPLPLYVRLMNELGDYLFEVELHNWGEPLLNKNIPDLIQVATDRGAQTTISTNFSFPFDESRAEALVASGLSQLGVSLDGASQETYEKYRVKGKLDLVLENVDKVIRAKEKLGSETPRMIWEFHVFDHNVHETEQARAMAEARGMDIDISKGWVTGPEWDPDGQYKFFKAPWVDACEFLWQRAIVNVDAGVSPCCGTFYKEDDYGSMESSSFMKIWNNEAFRLSRRMFKSAEADGVGRELICYDCPETITRREYLAHIAAGGDRFDFRGRFTSNDGFNYFFNRGPGGVSKNGASIPDGAIELQAVEAATPGERSS